MTRWNVVNAATEKLVYSLDSFPLLAVPFYILTGILMNTGGITERIFLISLKPYSVITQEEWDTLISAQVYCSLVCQVQHLLMRGA